MMQDSRKLTIFLYTDEPNHELSYRKTRASTPMPEAWQDDDMTMSSGDESDNVDLTDGSSSANEWSDIGGKHSFLSQLRLSKFFTDPINIQTTGSLLSFYSPLTRHYAASCSGMEGTTFTLTRVIFFYYKQYLSHMSVICISRKPHR